MQVARGVGLVKISRAGLVSHPGWPWTPGLPDLSQARDDLSGLRLVPSDQYHARICFQY